MVRADIFIRFLGSFLIQNCGSFQFFSAGRFFRFLATAAEGGEIRSNYFNNTEPVRKLQVFGCRLASLGDQIIRNGELKNQLAILKSRKIKF